jgi:ribosomal protein L12E/L44/L45/RPP1/RPP2
VAARLGWSPRLRENSRASRSVNRIGTESTDEVIHGISNAPEPSFQTQGCARAMQRQERVKEEEKEEAGWEEMVKR